jgi:pimeloyl-ACP methyl ester carboxylesterase
MAALEAMTDWSDPELHRLNAITMAVWDTGNASTLPPVLLCHGFPELAYSWRHQMADLPGLGIRAIAMDQRGYGATTCPDRIEDYDLASLTGDLVALLDAKRIEKAVFCGHDWGGLIVWAMATWHPARVAGVIGINTPYTKRAPEEPIGLYRRRFGDDHYIVQFQQVGVPEAGLEADIEKTFRYYMRRSDVTPAQFEARPEDKRNLAFLAALARFNAATATNPLLNETELAFYVEAFTRTGFSGPVNWYRNFTRNWHASASIPDRVSQPALMLMAENDVVLPPAMADGMEKYVPELERVLIRSCGHWTQQEKPAETTAAIADWIRRRFG